MGDDYGQIKVHPNPYSKEGLGQQVVDMSVAIAKLQTDMDWVKQALKDIKSLLDEEHQERNRMIDEFQEYVNKRLDDHEKRIQEQEERWSWTKGAIAGLSAITFILSLIQVLKLLGG